VELAAVCLLASVAAHAETATPPVLPPPDSWVPHQAGTLRVLNKLDSTVQVLNLHVGETAKLQSLSITLRACAIRPEGLPEDATAQLSIVDSLEGQPGFEGWILEKEPSLNMLEHPVYDVQLAGCT
jgi:hypothetical protein